MLHLAIGITNPQSLPPNVEYTRDNMNMAARESGPGQRTRHLPFPGIVSCASQGVRTRGDDE